MATRVTKCDYFSDSAQPLNSLVFVAPLLVVYELGMLWWGPDVMRNGAEVWLRNALDVMGFGQYFLLPILTVFSLIAWHYVSRRAWTISWQAVAGMLLESTALGILLLALFQILLHADGSGIENQTADSPATTMAMSASSRVFAYIGAGLYEELLFRLLLLPALAWGLIALGETPRAAWWGATGVSSVVFASAHYSLFVGVGETFLWSTFICRAVGGAVFAMLLAWRGFGITVGAHTLYDVLAGISQ